MTSLSGSVKSSRAVDVADIASGCRERTTGTHIHTRAVPRVRNGAYLLKNETQPFTGGPTYDCAGLFGALCGTVNPRWRHIFRSTWYLPGNLNVAATWRFLKSVSLDNNSSNPLLFGHSFLNQNTGGPALNLFNARLPSFNYLDLQVGWNMTSGSELRVGINNILDKDPPLVTSEITASGANNTYEIYDTLGRQLFVAFTAKF
jgi:outer membrane receptor protein involved in Fe transport